MQKKLKPKPRGRSGGRKPLPPAERAMQANIYLQAGLLENLQNLLPVAADRNKLFADWARAYVINNGESDRLLAQSPLSAKLAAYLEATDAPQELRDELESLMVARASDEVKIEGETIATKNGAYIV